MDSPTDTVLNPLNINWKTLITRGFESEELDYKAAQNWLSLKRTGKAKFVRHCLAMANTKGGYLEAVRKRCYPLLLKNFSVNKAHECLESS